MTNRKANSSHPLTRPFYRAFKALKYQCILLINENIYSMDALKKQKLNRFDFFRKSY
jgi:hypothetical protein